MPLLSRICRVLTATPLSRVALQEGIEKAFLEQDSSCFNGRGALQSGSAGGYRNASPEQDSSCFNGSGALHRGSAGGYRKCTS